MVLKYRWTDLDQGRLEQHLKMNSGVKTQLMELDIFKGSGIGLRVTNILEFMQAYKRVYACNREIIK